MGDVNSGKTSLIRSICGDLEPMHDECYVSIGGKISLVSERPWIINGTVRENILLDSEWNKERYDRFDDKI